VKDPLQMLLAAGAVPATNFPPNSRYAGVPVLKYDRGDGEPPVAYLARRLLPDPAKLALLAEHSVVQGDRLDVLASRYVGDPQLWWRIADANPELDPDELIAHIGRWLRITQPSGMPGIADA
jgi:hypothetical protein